MEKYKAILSIPVKNSVWKAKKEERIIEAENFNYFLMKVVTPEELNSGVRILEILVYSENDQCWYYDTKH